MSQAEVIKPDFALPYPTEINEGETLRDFGIRKEQECNESLNRIDTLRDGIAKIAMLADDSESVIDICSELLSEV